VIDNTGSVVCGTMNIEHSLEKVMNRVSVSSCQVRDSVCFCRAMLCIGRPMPSCGVCVSVRLVRGPISRCISETVQDRAVVLVFVVFITPECDR